MPSQRCPELSRSHQTPQATADSRQWFHGVLDSLQTVNFALAAALVERVGTATEIEPKRHRAKAQVAAHGVEQVAPIALRKLFELVAEHDEAGWPGLHLGDVAQLDPPALGRGRRVGLDRLLEP